ncbi:MAG TPA: hypothetical protein VLH79_03795 [Chthonomonadales bacterium]|nr:hypothetical protein [Chthonomonadales bacterium]
MPGARADDTARGWMAAGSMIEADAVLGALPWVTLAVGPSLQVLGANAAWREAVRYACPNEAGLANPVGALLTDLLAPGEAERWLPHLAGILSGRARRVVDSLRFTWQGAHCAYCAVASRLCEPSRCAILSCTDVGPESDVARHRAHLEAPRHDLVRQIANRLTHRINNPLFVITATIEDLLAEADGPQMRSRLEGALGAAWKVGESVRGLVELRDMLADPRLHLRSIDDLERILREP